MIVLGRMHCGRLLTRVTTILVGVGELESREWLLLVGLHTSQYLVTHHAAGLPPKPPLFGVP